MLIEELVLHNFGIYRGRHSINLKPIRKESPIILIGGLNGGGKTTFLDALQLALYGKRARISNRSGLAYEKYLKRSINTGVSPEEGAAVAIQFRHYSNGSEMLYRVHRTWRTNNNNIVENVEVLVNGCIDRVVTAGWDDVVEEFLPASISHLFFFDGEKIEAFADIANSRRLLEKAVQSLLGLDIVDRLKTDLSVFESKQKIKLKSAPDRQKLDDLEAQIEEIEQSRILLVEQLAHQRRIIDDLEKREGILREKFRAAGGELYATREKIENEQRNLQIQLDAVEERLIEFAGGAIPLILVSDLLTQVVQQSEREEQANQNRVIADVLNERDELILQSLRGKTFTDESIKLLASLLEDDRQIRRRTTEVVSYLYLNENTRAQIQSLSVGNSISNLVAQLTTYLRKAESLRLSLDDCLRKLKGVPDTEQVARLIEEIESVRAQIEKGKVDLFTLESEERRFQIEKETRRGKWSQIVDETITIEQERKDVDRVIQHVDKVRKTIEGFQQRMLESKVERIENLILDSYRNLLRKKALISDLRINIRNFSLELIEIDGELVSPERLSAGERQLLAVSILWGLARASGRPLPVSIDTPLGRLDGSHRLNLVEKYFPNASHQVFLLSTDEEIDQELYEAMKDSVSRAYTLDYDDKEQVSTIREGYFDLKIHSASIEQKESLSMESAA